MLEHGRSYIAQSRIQRHGLAGYTGLKKSFGHPVRGPRLLRTRLEHQTDLQRYDRQPQTVNARGVRGQDHAQYRRRGLVAAHHPVFFAVASTQDAQVQPAGKRSEDVLQICQHIVELLHVLAAHVLGQSRGG